MPKPSWNMTMIETRCEPLPMRLIPWKVALTVSVAMLWLTACLAPQQKPDPPTSTAVPAAGAVAMQERREWRFDNDGVRFDNQLPAARLSGVQRIRNGAYRVSIAPESSPINPSPWYGFRIHSDAPRAVELQFTYPQQFRHRYVPKLSRDGRTWQEVDAPSFVVDAKGNTRLQLQLEAGELRVFAQPPFLPEDFAAWSTRIAAQVDAQPQTFGTSVQGRPLQLFEFGAGAQAPVVLVLGRQHPPENTGTRALLGFVETLAADTPQAHAFRERVHVLVAPLLNPDGLLEGHWRGNANGVDINRDWGTFAQPETRALRDALAARGIGPGRVVFAIDFHSTDQDVFYTVADDPTRTEGGLLQQWIAAMQSRFKIKESPSVARNGTSQNWAVCRLGAPSVTYEVGDATPSAVLDEVTQHAAIILMEDLLANPRQPAAPPRCNGYAFPAS
jgi:hypothetical protein